MSAAELRERLAAEGVDAEVAGRLASFGAFLLEGSRRANVTGASTPEELVPHLLDALTLVPFAGPGLRLADIGSGGGLPAIPLALATGVVPTLVEPIGKKATFLRDALAELGLPGSVEARRAEVAGRDPALREQFDLATARAVAGPTTVAELTIPFLRVGGRLLMQRGAVTAAERASLDDALLVLGSRIREERATGDQQRLFVIEKVEPTGERFPRRDGVPAKRPLCVAP